MYFVNDVMFCNSAAGWNDTAYTFRLRVAKDNREVFSDQTIYIMAGFVPDISVK